MGERQGGVLSIRPFRRLWVALSLSSLGDWLSLLALSVLADALGGSRGAVAVSGVWLAALLPTLVFGPLAGAVADRFDRRLNMITSDVIRAILYISIPLNLAIGVVDKLTWLFVAQFLASCASLFWSPARDASVPDLVPPGQLERASQVGLFTTSPQYLQTSLGEASVSGGPSVATGVFDHVSLTWPSGSWAGGNLGGGGGGPGSTVGIRQAAGTFTITGSGDIAPVVSGGGGVGVTVAQALVGTFAGLIVLAVVGAMFITAEYRRRLILVTLAAAPRRGRVLAAKAVVIGTVTFAAALVSAAIAVVLGQRILRGNGAYVYPASTLTQVRVIVGTAAVLAVSAVIALAIGAVLRRGAGAVAVIVAVIVLPYMFTVAAPILPAGAAGWLLRITPAAAFAVQQTLIQYPQVSNTYTAAYGYYPLPPWAGLAVLFAWAALALGLGVFLLRRRDA